MARKRQSEDVNHTLDDRGLQTDAEAKDGRHNELLLKGNISKAGMLISVQRVFHRFRIIIGVM